MRTSQRGLSLIEVLLAGALFSIIALLSFVLLKRGVTLWKELVEAESASLQLAKAASRVRGDVIRCSLQNFSQASVPASLAGGGHDGSAICFLSALDPATGEMAIKADGTPFWQRNVLYYLVVPDRHAANFGMDCLGGVGPRGFDDRCPHKALIRKIIDSGVATTPQGDPAVVEEALLTDVTPFLTRPNGYDTSLLSAELGVESAEIVATHLLWFEVSRAKSEVSIDLRAVAIKDAQANLALGVAALGSGRYTSNRVLSIFPSN